jgi:hypothetical protein
VVALIIFIAFLIAGIFGIGRVRKELLGDRGSTGDAEVDPALLQMAIAEHERRAAASAAAAAKAGD